MNRRISSPGGMIARFRPAIIVNRRCAVSIGIGLVKLPGQAAATTESPGAIALQCIFQTFILQVLTGLADLADLVQIPKYLLNKRFMIPPGTAMEVDGIVLVSRHLMRGIDRGVQAGFIGHAFNAKFRMQPGGAAVIQGIMGGQSLVLPGSMHINQLIRAVGQIGC